MLTTTTLFQNKCLDSDHNTVQSVNLVNTKIWLRYYKVIHASYIHTGLLVTCKQLQNGSYTQMWHKYWVAASTRGQIRLSYSVDWYGVTILSAQDSCMYAMLMLPSYTMICRFLVEVMSATCTGSPEREILPKPEGCGDLGLRRDLYAFNIAKMHAEAWWILQAPQNSYVLSSSIIQAVGARIYCVFSLQMNKQKYLMHLHIYGKKKPRRDAMQIR